MFLTYVIFFLSEELLLTFLARQFCWQHISSSVFLLFLSEKTFISLSFLRYNFNGYRILDWWVCF